MAFFAAEKRKIESVRNHPNADRLDIAKLEGLSFQFVVQRDSVKPGDERVYFPIDSILPADLVERLGMTGKFSGAEKNRVKTIKLRGEISQGFCAPVAILDGMTEEPTPEKITRWLGVTKYEPRMTFAQGGILHEFGGDMSVYDIEGADRYGDIVEKMLDEVCCITEKLEGTNMRVAWVDGQLYVCQRNHWIEEIEGKPNCYWEAARLQNLPQIVTDLQHRYVGARSIQLYGELCGPGVQGNIYHLDRLQFFAFDLRVDGRWLGYEEFQWVCAERGITRVPVDDQDRTLREMLGALSVQDYSNGDSRLAIRSREGIVIKPREEKYVEGFGRMIIKQRSPAYLAAEQ